MVDTRSRALRNGAGRVDDVTTELCNLPVEDSALQGLICKAGNALHELTSTADGLIAAKALALAVLNHDFRKTGDLWQLDKDSQPDKTYLLTGPPREAIANLAGL